MFFQLPYKQLGFTDEEWEEITPGDRRLIRDWELNGRNELRTVLYNDYIDDSKIRKVLHHYQLRERPQIKLTFSSFNLY
jgi:hypothetical protein